VRSVARILAEKRIGAVVVVDSQGKIEGIASERDFVRAIAFEGAAALDRPLGELMTKSVRTCSPEDTESELMALMTEHRIRHEAQFREQISAARIAARRRVICCSAMRLAIAERAKAL
jgi:CBS domain-containing protein